MELSSHVTTNLNDWVETSFITEAQREAIVQLLTGALQDAQNAYTDNCYDSAWSDGYEAGHAEVEVTRDDWYDRGYAAALADYNIGED